MANNYEDVVGFIKVKMVTPVIRALFSGYYIDDKYPGNGEAWIGSVSSNYENANWDRMMPELGKLCDYLKITLPEIVRQRLDDNYGCEENEVEFADDTVAVFEALLIHFGTIDHPDVRSFINYLRSLDNYDTPELSWLFVIAHLLNDGHGLESYQVDAAWTCSKPRIGEFGGWGEYHSHRVHSFAISTDGVAYGVSLDEDLLAKRYDAAAARIVDKAERLLKSITNIEDRQQVQSLVVQGMNTLHTPIPQGQPASNEPVANPYEVTPVVMTNREQIEHLANALAHIAIGTYRQTPELKPERVAEQVMRDTIDLLECGDFAYGVPPMQLVPVNPQQGRYTGVVWREGEGSVLADWNYNQPITIAEDVTLGAAFEDRAERIRKASGDAAKTMFGT